ncbi:MAG: alcohol dehydrogenase catalytic domain-containing protein [Nitrospirae bacterium]|nr:alcohol dehydrogenase catalytic domain-containing protein [Nitrospirota bacterium]
MRAVVFDGRLHVKDIEKPVRQKGEALVKVSIAGICNTDHEITRGYIPDFNGILGHEFLGVVEDADDKGLIGKRVAGEINLACGACEFCKNDLGRHCPSRSVLGIINKDGAFAEYLTLPAANIFVIPDCISDAQAVFIEPLAAALEIFEQVRIVQEHKVLLIGDGKLALLIALVLKTTGCRLTMLGKHREKLSFAAAYGIDTAMVEGFTKSQYDIVIEASGKPSGFMAALDCVNPRGTIVLKSTYAEPFLFNPFQIVVNEITVVGSRCGRFEDAIRFLQSHPMPLDKLISAEFDLEDAEEAFVFSARPDVFKVLLKI